MPAHDNRGLFSDYYLDHLLPDDSSWEVLFDEARAVRDELSALLSTLNLSALDEAQLESQWVQPVLKALGHHYAVQVKIRYRDTGYRKPDYLLTRTADEARALTGEIYQPAEIQHALAVADAKKYGTPLDRASEKERNPGQQIDEYLRYSELRWGILTDGRTWRLYERDSSKYNLFYAVDLVTLLNTENTRDFLYFYAFFRQAAFTGWLEQILKASTAFAEKLSDDLEDQVYDALEEIAQGFLEYRRNRLTEYDLQTIYENSLVLLYRLLFVFYAESRDILSPGQHGYGRISLSAIKEDVRDAMDFPKKKHHADSTIFYARLSDLFFIIDAGSPQFNLPAYNGKLFNEETHAFLKHNAVGDFYMMAALDRLARIEVEPGKKVFVDYRDLDVRHLGAIYEKLLDYELDLAHQPLTLKNGKYVPAKDGDSIIKQPGQVYLRTGSNERKITGSYYTPDYIVRFIVERTLEPLLRDITERHGTQDEEGRWQFDHPQAVIRDILSLNILDPAIGSGHFLVDTVAYMAEWLRNLALQPAPDEDELTYWKRQVVTSCIYGVDINPLAVELAKVALWLITLAKGKPLAFLDHHLRIGNSLVGTRIQDIYPQLPDLNSTRRRKDPDQLALFDEQQVTGMMLDAVKTMDDLEHTIVNTVDDIYRQERLYQHMQDRLTAWKIIADVYLARQFGLPLSQEQWNKLREMITEAEHSEEIEALLRDAEEIAGRYRFLHPDLTFPEIFYNPDGTPRPDPGFDVVIGNPPYVRQERIQPIKPYLETHYDVYQGTADLFLYFFERGLRFLKPGQQLGYITSGTYMNTNSAGEFRKYIRENAAFETVFNFGENQPFKNAEMVYPTIAILRKDKPKETFRSYFIEKSYPYSRLEEAFWKTIEEGASNSRSDVTTNPEWRFQATELTDLCRKITDKGTELRQVVNGRIYFGVKTGLNEAFIVSDEIRQKLVAEHLSSQEIIKPIVRGEDLRPWYQLDSKQYLIFARHGIEIEKYPAIKKHLERYREQLEPEPPGWNRNESGQWKGRKAGIYKWYELQDPVNFYQEFDEPKIFWPDIGKLPRFSMDKSGLYNHGKGYFLVTDSYSLLALLNSRPLWFVLSQIATPLRLRAGLWQYQAKLQFVERLPIPELTPAQESELAEIAETMTALAKQRYQRHEATRHRVRTDLRTAPDQDVNDKLFAWWELDPSTFREEVKKAFKRDIPVKQRGEWEQYLVEQQSEHHQLTARMIAHETRLNEIVYEAFALTPDERALIEKHTKYPYGAV